MTMSKAIRVAGTLLEATPVFDAYWYFAAERQRIFFKRIKRSNALELSLDPIFQHYKFTNTYRASDRVSQFLIRDVIFPEQRSFSIEDTFFRVLLFKLFNKIETWRSLEDEFGELSLAKYDFQRFDEFLTDRHARGIRNYAAAYIMPSASRVFGYVRKHSNHLALLEWMIREKFPSRLNDASSMEEGFRILSQAPSLGPFLAYQFITDINYSRVTNFSEQEFVVPGPGALDGISKCFTNARDVEPGAIIRAIAEQQGEMFEQRDIDFPSLWGRPLQFIDCQNLFCEISKYSRVAFPEVSGVAGRTRIKQKFKSSGPLPQPFYPPDWGLNSMIEGLGGSGYACQRESEIASAEQLMLF